LGLDLRVGDIGDDLRVGGDLHLCMRGGGDDDLRVGGHLHLCVWGGSNDLHVGDGGDDLGTTATAHFGGLDLCVGGGGVAAAASFRGGGCNQANPIVETEASVMRAVE
jgi:hypothetical protein